MLPDCGSSLINPVGNVGANIQRTFNLSDSKGELEPISKFRKGIWKSVLAGRRMDVYICFSRQCLCQWPLPGEGSPPTHHHFHWQIGLHDTLSTEVTAAIPFADPPTWLRSLPIWRHNHAGCRGLSQPYPCGNNNEFRVIFSTFQCVSVTYFNLCA